MPVNSLGGGVITGRLPGAPPPAAKPGYMYDPNTGRQIPIAGSGQDLLNQRARQQRIEDSARDLNFSRTEADRSARDTLRNKLMTMLDRPTETSAYAGSGFGGGGGVGGGVAPIAAFNPSQFMSLMTTSPAAALPANIGTIALPDTSAAQANIFARAKDKVGQETAGSLTSLRSALAGRGLLGGGAEVRGAQNILTAGQGQLGDTTREQAIQEANRQTDFAKLGYEGAISQRGQDITARGQDIGAQESARDAALRAAQIGYEGQLTGRGQDLSAQEAAQDRALRAQEAAANRNTTRYDSVTGLLGKLY